MKRSHSPLLERKCTFKKAVCFCLHKSAVNRLLGNVTMLKLPDNEALEVFGQTEAGDIA